MEDLFRSYWWLLFPLAWFIGSAWTSWLNYRRQRETLDIVRRYADAGREVPPELMKVLDRPIDSEAEFWGSGSVSSGSGGGGHAFSLVMFTALAGGFGYAAWRDFYGNGDAFALVAFVMGAIALGTLASWIFQKRG
jgi:hypothetical protein